MAKFCKRCGSRLDEMTGRCPNCDRYEYNPNPWEMENPMGIPAQEKPLTKKELKAEKKKQKRAQRTFKQKIKRFFIKLLAVILALLIAAGGCMCTLVYFDKIDVPIIKNVFNKIGVSRQEKVDDNLAHNLEEFEEIDIGEELRNESQVLETIDVSTSDQSVSEATITKLFNDKGFTDSVIFTAYSMDGTYNGDGIIDGKSTECHPLYYASYINSDNYCWTVYYCNGEWSASPISYMYSGLTKTEIIVSEKEYIMSYDSDTNCFYKMIPSSSECIIKTVSVINSEMLDELAKKEFSIS